MLIALLLIFRLPLSCSRVAVSALYLLWALLCFCGKYGQGQLPAVGGRSNAVLMEENIDDADDEDGASLPQTANKWRTVPVNNGPADHRRNGGRSEPRYSSSSK